MAKKTVAQEPAEDPIYQEVKSIFSSHLERHAQRNTPERYAILKEVYSREDHFDADTLYLEMKRKNYRVSRATVYNTLELLLACELIRKHQFGESTARYEKSYGNRQHDHLICMDCKHVMEFCDPRLQQVYNTLEDIFDFDIKHHALTMYGACKKENCEHRS